MFLVSPERPEQLAGAICELANDPVRRAEFAGHARARGETLDIERSIHAVEAVYREVLHP